MQIQWKIRESQRKILVTGCKKGSTRWIYRIRRDRDEALSGWGLWKYESRGRSFFGACRTLGHARARCEADYHHLKGRMLLSPPEDVFTEAFNQGFVAAVAIGLYEGLLSPDEAKHLLKSVVSTVDWATISQFDKSRLRKHGLIPRRRKAHGTPV